MENPKRYKKTSSTNPIYFSWFLLILFLFSGCEKDEIKQTLTVTPTKISIPADGGSNSFNIKTNSPSWQIYNSNAEEIELSNDQGTSSVESIVVNVTGRTLINRYDTLLISAGTADPVKVIVQQPSSEYLYSLQSDLAKIDFIEKNISGSFTITSTAPLWTIQKSANWVVLDGTSGGEGETQIQIAVDALSGTNERSTSLIISGENANSIEITITQKAGLYPDYNTTPIAPDQTGMESSALQLASKIKIGWNIGNTLEAIGGETAWGNPMVTEELIKLVKSNGFNAIRIPCSWNQYLENAETAKIKSVWLDRVKEVVKYCVDNDMYAVLNIHWDGGWMENNCTIEAQYENNAKQKAFWQQIATHLRDFDEHLIFAGANEPNVENETQMNVLMSYHQTFIDAVRATGGKNAYRVLVVQGPSTDIEKTNQLMTSMPEDIVDDRLMAEIHYYTPYQFCLMTEDANWGKMFYFWGANYHSTNLTNRNANWGEEDDIEELFGLMKSQFVDKGIPVILGEFAAIKRTFLTGDDLQLHLNSRAYYLKYVAYQAKLHGMLPFYWDAGNMGENASALFNRQNNSVFDQQALDALMTGIE
nr:cellulase family glycosylhydrolase [uncultured Carboxylicivirga sp.]